MKKSNNKGITLVALIITIIILLILAGVAITQLTDSGLFGKTQEAKQKWENAQNEENEKIAKYKNEIDSFVNGNRGDLTKEELKSLFNQALQDSQFRSDIIAALGIESSSNRTTLSNVTLPSTLNTWSKIADFPSGYDKTNTSVSGYATINEINHQLPYSSAVTFGLKNDGIYAYLTNNSFAGISAKLFLQKY